MKELVVAGGWMMIPIIICAIIAITIIIERVRALQPPLVIPGDLKNKVLSWLDDKLLDHDQLAALSESSPLGRIVAAGLTHQHDGRDRMKERIEDEGRHVVHDLERYLNALGTIAAISPLLGLLGTVIGMVKVFAAITAHGVGNPAVLAGGISEALITTAAGLTVAIPTLIGYRYLRRWVDSLVVEMEQQTLEILDKAVD
ncbi:MAG: MotA/TolQ/ExbB proton channel family protein [Gammaproteobacteria bacterium]|nr:MotA/TolQ/ExbB proton channel family protein [Gammaproteobacteria bacterium]